MDSTSTRTRTKRARWLTLGVAVCLATAAALPGIADTAVNDTAKAVPGAAPVDFTPSPRSSAATSAASATSIAPLVSATGKVRLSLDGLGTNNPDGGNIDVEKASAGATVRSAHLLVASTGYYGYVPVDGEVTLAGTPVNWDPSSHVANGISSNNAWAEVTTLVKPVVDAAPAGLVGFNLAEGPNSYLYDGAILAVILDDPSLLVDNTVAVLYGAQQPTGDSFNVLVSEPIDKTDPDFGMSMSLGISFGYQPAGQFSQIDVNGARLTTSAGGQDDGEPDNGALITIGGIGDSTTNPSDPNATDGCGTDPRCDDELYDLAPLVNTGDTSIAVDTLNPSNDDNVFVAAFELRDTVAVIGEGILLSPSGTTAAVGATHALTATVQDDNGDPISGRNVSFEIVAGPNDGLTGQADTDASGDAVFSYTSTLAGTDTIEARFTDSESVVQTSNQVTHTWTAPTVEGPPGNANCSNGSDDDGDGLIDLADPDCQAPEGPPGDPSCSDEYDNDGDGLIDANDPDCQTPTPPDPCSDSGILTTPTLGQYLYDTGLIAPLVQNPDADGPISGPVDAVPDPLLHALLHDPACLINLSLLNL